MPKQKTIVLQTKPYL